MDDKKADEISGVWKKVGSVVQSTFHSIPNFVPGCLFCASKSATYAKPKTVIALAKKIDKKNKSHDKRTRKR